MKQALEVLEQINRLSIGENAIALPGEIDAAMDNLRAAIEQVEKPVAWMYDFMSDNRDEVIRDWMTQDYADIKRENGFNVRPLYTGPHQEQPLKINPADCHIRVGEVSEPISVGGKEPYDQTALELCEKCGWKAIIPGDGCLVCARQKAKPAAWVYPEFWDHLKQVNCGTAYRLPGDGMQPLYTVPTAPKPLRWVDTIIPGDRVIDNDDKTQARVSKLIRQRPAAPDYFKLEFDDGSYIDVTDNELIANYKPLPEARKPVAYADSRIHGWPDCFVMEPDPPHTVPLYAAPREWVGLTEEEYQIIHSKNYNYEELALAVEAKLKEKNHAG